MPCISGLRPQSDWIVCSAPEMTTVSKPNRKPARAEVTDQTTVRACMGGGSIRKARRARGDGPALAAAAIREDNRSARPVPRTGGTTMKTKILATLACALAAASLAAAAADDCAGANALTTKEKAAGWQLLFD